MSNLFHILAFVRLFNLINSLDIKLGADRSQLHSEPTPEVKQLEKLLKY